MPKDDFRMLLLTILLSVSLGGMFLFGFLSGESHRSVEQHGVFNGVTADWCASHDGKFIQVLPPPDSMTVCTVP